MTQALNAMRGTDGGRVRPLPEAVAPTFVFLAGDESDYVSGQVIAADGGVTA
jgi:NAD(P)-dependent dehydrogenase (short-subunit alcohol dehydrogenase family)